MEIAILLIFTLTILGAFAFATFMVWRRMVKIEPGELAVTVGGPRQTANGVTFEGFDTATEGIIAGRILEPAPVGVVYKMDIRPLELDITLNSATTSDARNINLTAQATVDFDTTPEGVHRPIESFLERPRHEVESTATKIIASKIRSVVSQLPQAQLSSNPSELARNAQATAAPDLERLGLQLQSLTIH